MQVFQGLDDYDFGEVHVKRDHASGLRAIVAIHDTRRGPALGGCRFVHYESDADAMTDALRLARGMTYKAAISDLPLGGGKSVIIKPKGDFDRNALFSSFGQFVEDLGGRYITAEDSGTRVEDMDTIRAKTSHVTGVTEALGGAGDPSPFTALGVRRGMEALVKAALDRSSLEGVKVALCGVGNVGYYLCKEVHNLGAKLVVADIDPKKAQRAVDEFDAELVSLEDIHRVDCDVYAPCALGGALNDKTVPELKCKVVAGAANNQLLRPEHGDELHKRGILYGADYAINAGGLVNVYYEAVKEYDAKVATERVMGIYDILLDIAERAQKTNKPSYIVADEVALEKLSQS